MNDLSSAYASWTETPGTPELPGFKTFKGIIEKPDTDQRDYRVIVLDNGLRAVIIHDPHADKSAACLSVHVGHLNDPVDVPGLAHFTEHMISKGSKPFPAANDLMHFITSNGGIRNASTGSSIATYWFSIGSSLLTEAVPRLAASFHSPLFPASVTTREIHAVDSENKKNLQDDNRRIFQLCRSLSAPDHPWLKFGTGNFISLTDAARKNVEEDGGGPGHEDVDTEDGGAVGRETRRRMVEWKEHEYCAGRMTFAILGKESLDDLTKLTVREFSPVVNLNADPRPTVHDYPWTEDQQSCNIFVETVKDFYGFKLSFPIPYQIPQFRTRPASYLAHFLGHEGPGSLCSYLKRKGWLLSISAGAESWNRGINLFTVDGKLTSMGYINYQVVILAIFNYISILKSSFPLPQFHFEEMKRMSELSFENREKTQAHTYVTYAAAQLAPFYPTEWLLNANTLFREWNPESVKTILDCLVPESGRVIIMANKHTEDVVGGTIKWGTEKWYGTQYIIKKFEDSFVAKMKAPNENDGLFLPQPNLFIPTNLQVDKKEILKPAEAPKCIHHSRLSTLFYKKDDQFWVPKGDVHIALKTRLADATPRHAVLTRLLVKLLDDALSEVTYDAHISGLSYSLTSHSKALEVRAYGYNEKLSTLLGIVLDKLKNLDIHKDRLDVFIEELGRGYDNFRMKKPVEHSQYYSTYLLRPLQWTPEEQAIELKDVSIDDVRHHKEELLSRLKIECLVVGNFKEKEALDILKLTEDTLTCRALAASEIPLPRSLILPEGANFVYQRTVYDSKEPNSSIIIYHHFGDISNQKLRAKLDLLTHIIREPAFTELRTKQQLGYITSTIGWSSTGTMGLRVRIQSQKDPTFIEQRVEEFLASFGSLLEGMSDEAFASQKAGLIVKKEEKVKNLAEEASYFWDQISSGYYDFAQDASDAEVIRTLTKEEILHAYKAFLHPMSTIRRKLAVHMLSQHLESVLPLPEGVVKVEDPYDFKIIASELGAGAMASMPEISTAKQTKKPPLAREPGKSLLPLARVQKILKADEEMPMVAKEATFLIALATEEFIKRLSLESHQLAARERRTVVQERDIGTVVRKGEEYWFLRGIIGSVDGSSSARAKPKPKKRDQESEQTREPTILDRFVRREAMEKEDEFIRDAIMNEDGTMSMS